MSTLVTNTFTGKTSAGSIVVTGEGGSTTTNLQQGLAKSQVQFDGTTNTINGSLNIASMTDHATSDQAVTFTNNMGDTNYCAESDTVSESDESDPRDTSINLSRTFSSSTYAIIAKYDASSADDRTKMFGVVYGDLA